MPLCYIRCITKDNNYTESLQDMFCIGYAWTKGGNRGHWGQIEQREREEGKGGKTNYWLSCSVPVWRNQLHPKPKHHAICPRNKLAFPESKTEAKTINKSINMTKIKIKCTQKTYALPVVKCYVDKSTC